MASKYIKKFKVPNSFEDILSDFTKEILRNQPKDIIEFGIEYFKGLETNAKFDYKNKGENRPENYKRPENQKPNIINAPNNLEISHEDKNRLQRSMDKIDRINKDPVPVEKKEGEVKGYQKKDEEVNTQKEYHYARHISKYEDEEEESHVIRKEEVHVTKQVTVITKEKIIRNGEVIKDETNIKKISSGNDEDNQSGGRYGSIQDNEEHKKEYDDWFTRHSIDKQVIDYKPEKEKQDENLKRNEIGYKTWFRNHSVRSIDQSQSGEVPREEEGGHGGEYSEWFERHSKDKMVVDYKPEKKQYHNVERCEVDYATWFENHSKMTSKYS